MITITITDYELTITQANQFINTICIIITEIFRNVKTNGNVKRE